MIYYMNCLEHQSHYIGHWDHLPCSLHKSARSDRPYQYDAIVQYRQFGHFSLCDVEYVVSSCMNIILLCKLVMPKMRCE